jgi:hypothetical protein
MMNPPPKRGRPPTGRQETKTIRVDSATHTALTRMARGVGCSIGKLLKLLAKT